MNKLQRVLAVIPTYNERDNIEKIIDHVLEADPRLSILVVDDGSPDGTAEIVKERAASTPRIALLQRSSKQGLGTAYVAGFKRAVADGFDAVVEIDADMSHNPKYLPRMLDRIDEGADFVIGSRYKSGVNVINWPLQRLLLSYFASVYSRIITGMPFRDLTAGYTIIRREVLESINLDLIRSNGYAFQIEIKFMAWKKGFKLVETPIVFVERAIGTSKMNKKIVVEAVWMVWKLRLGSLFGS